MKKAYTFVRSMKFGILLLLIVAGFSVVGSLIPQTFEADWYIENYPRFGETVLALGLHRIFAQWYFIVVCVLLGLSLGIAVISRLLALSKLLPQTLIVPDEGFSPDELDEEKASRLRKYLQKKRYRELNTGQATVYYKNRAGYFGSALVHLSLLLILIFGGLLLSLSDIEDVLLLPGETALMANGSSLHLFSFTRLDEETGREESISVIEVTTSDGRSSGVREIRVNRPLRFNSYIYYQFNHLYAGSITAVDTQTGGWDRFYLVERSFLSADNRTGIWFETVFQGWRIDEETGRIIPLRYDAPIFPDPLYYFMLVDDSVQEYRFAVPGSHVHVGNVRFEFNELINYPGIRVSFSPHPIPALLLFSALLLMAGLFVSFYLSPSILVLKGNRYKLTASQSSGVGFEIKAMLYEGEEMPESLAKAKATGSGKAEESEREIDI